MNAELKGVEVQASIKGNHEFAVEHALFRELFAEGIDHLGEVAIERLFIAALEEDFVAIAKNQDPETVPLGLVDPVSLMRYFVHALGKHGKDWRIDRKVHQESAQLSG